MHRIRCSEIWGGIQNADLDVCTSGVTASLYSQACDGGRGGDIYFFSVCGSDRLTRIAIADVAGHGAAISALSRGIFDSLAARMNTLEGNGVLTDLNAVVAQQGFMSMTTAAVIGFYLGDGQLYFSYAGHPPVFVRRRGARDWQPIQLASPTVPGNLPLGVLDDTAFDQETLPLRPGDRLFLYTDGVLEAPAPDGAQFGEERLRAALDAAGNGELSCLKQGVLDALRAYTGGSLAHDDVTVMAMEVRGGK